MLPRPTNLPGLRTLLILNENKVPLGMIFAVTFRNDNVPVVAFELHV
jgi:hypothetical protein